MGGGGTGGYRNIGNVDKLLQEAKDRLNNSGRKNVFISFAYEDANEVNLLRGQAKNENSDIEFNDWSVKDAFNSKNADYIKRQITERIKQSSTTVVYVSDQTKNSNWVNWEVQKSIELNKRVIAVHKGDKPPRSLPDAVKGNKSINLIKWKHLKDHL
ncbi:MAG: molecular chaperone Tir [Sneathiella sp.]|nr:MAG: molecular chaperone Tir [Sneathiella sp.]